MTQIDGTSVTLAFVPIPDGHAHPPIFYGMGEGACALGSVNAGNAATLDIGGGGINRGFKAVLSKAGHDIGAYETRHTALAAKIGTDGTETEVYDPAPGEALRLIHAYAKGARTSASGHRTGLAFVDVFAQRNCPDGNTHNAAMVYACPPFGDDDPDDDAFLTAVEATAATIVEAVGSYNAVAPDHGAPAIEALRLRLYSSGIYNRTPKVPADRIARHIFAGLSAALARDAGGIRRVELPVSGDPSDRLFDVLEAGG